MRRGVHAPTRVAHNRLFQALSLQRVRGEGGTVFEEPYVLIHFPRLGNRKQTKGQPNLK